jgi:hypothetical protein
VEIALEIENLSPTDTFCTQARHVPFQRKNCKDKDTKNTKEKRSQMEKF